jgi:hypothetical protein
MTVIAWDGNMLAADKRTTLGGVAYTSTKIERIVTGAGTNSEEPAVLLVGASGESWACKAAIEWVRGGRKPEEFPVSQSDKEDWAGLVVVEHRPGWKPGATRVLRYERSPYPYEMEDVLLAFGAGADFALAALHLGKNAVEAVELACKLSVHCGNGVDFLRV